MSNHPHRSTASRKVIARWSATEKAGIWENLTQSITLYDDRTVYRGHTIKWANNSGSLAEKKLRITGHEHAALMRLARAQKDDEADYTDDAFGAIRDAVQGY